MRKTLLIVALASGLAITGSASAHGGGGGGALGAALVGAVVGVAIGSAIAAPVYAAPAPVYVQPAPVVYAAPAYGPPPGYCYSPYARAYVQCAPRRAYYDGGY